MKENICGKFKFELKEIGSRVVVIPMHITLSETHAIIMAMFNFGDWHLWEFCDSLGRCYAHKNEDDMNFGFDEAKKISPDKVCLSDVLPERGCKIDYTYDFGDGWDFVITRMADPKEPDLRCLKVVGPDGIEDFGGPWDLKEDKSKWHIPSIEEVSKRLQYVGLSPRQSGTGLVRKMDKAFIKSLKELSPAEWKIVCELGETGAAGFNLEDKRLIDFLSSLPGVKRLGKSFPGFLFDLSDAKIKTACKFNYVFYCNRIFARTWKKNRDKWTVAREEDKK